MKKRITPLVLALAFLFQLNCSDDDGAIRDEGINLDPEEVTQMIEDLYTIMYTPGSGGTDAEIDFGQKGFDIFSDILVGDMAVGRLLNWAPNYYMYHNISEYITTSDYTEISNYQVWTYYYRIIKKANRIIEPLDISNDSAGIEHYNHALGQGLAMRAYAYFYLTQFMANDYEPDSDILPIYTDASTEFVAKSSTEKVFQLIESDLNRAIDLLETYERPTKKHVNSSVAKALLAYAIAAQRNPSRLQEVVDLCDAIIAESGARIMNYDEVTGGFNNVNIDGWIWGVDITPDMGLSQNSWWGQVDYFSYGYAGVDDRKAINQNLYNLISDEDVRKDQFWTSAGYNYLQPFDKFYDPDRIPFGSSELVKADYLYMRLAEFHFLKAEALAKLGQEAASKAALNQVLSERLEDSSYLNGLSGTALLNEIFLQTRIEFWGEGKTYLALKRNEQVTGERGENHWPVTFNGQFFQHDDERLTFEIPASEIQNNPFINDQN